MAPKRTPSRKEKALATRRRILEAAYRLFCRQGYGPTTMDSIAKEARVAVQTIYFTFHTKGAMLGETLGAAVVGFERFAPRPEDFDTAEAPKALMPWWQRFEAEPDARRALALFVEASLAINRRAAPLVVAMHAAAADPDARAVFELSERRRIDAFREAARTFARKEPRFRRGVSVAHATDLLLVLLGTALYNDLTSSRGWSAAECKRFVNDTLVHHLFGP